MKRELLEKSPFDLSGGEKRRAAIAGVMAMEPKVLILDEPTAGLDPKGRKRVLSLIRNYREQTGSAVILVSHSMEDIAQMATRVVVLNDSRIALTGTVDDVFSRDADLVKMGLNVPQITRIFSKLRADGMNVRADVYTVEQGRTEFALLRKEGGVIKDITIGQYFPATLPTPPRREDEDCSDTRGDGHHIFKQKLFFHGIDGSFCRFIRPCLESAV